jgi:hypothetical protein
LDSIGSKLEHLQHECLKCLAQEMGMWRDHRNCSEVIEDITLQNHNCALFAAMWTQ